MEQLCQVLFSGRDLTGERLLSAVNTRTSTDSAILFKKHRFFVSLDDAHIV